MDETTYKLIKRFIFDNHNHHADSERFVMTLDSKSEMHIEDQSRCEDGNNPYINSMHLEKFIDSLVDREWQKRYEYKAE